VFCPRKILVDIHPKILGVPSCVFYFRVINFSLKLQDGLELLLICIYVVFE